MPTRSSTDGAQVPTHVRLILWVDCSGAILVGALLLVFADWLRPLFQFPPLLYFTIAAANGVYGTFSLVLASLPQRPLSLIATLAIANAFWGCACLIGAASMLGRASIFGMAHLILEGLVVFSLARIEWRHRAWLAAH